MTKQQMKNLDLCLSEGSYMVNLEEGKIYSSKTGKLRFIGHKQKIEGYTVNRVCLTYNKKRYFFQLGEIIAYLIGIFDNLEEPEKYIVTRIDKSQKTNMFNIQLNKIQNLGKETRFKEIKEKDKIAHFKQVFKNKEVAKVFKCSVSTVERVKLI